MKLVTMAKMRLSYLRALDDQSLLLTKLQLKTKLRVTVTGRDNVYKMNLCSKSSS